MYRPMVVGRGQHVTHIGVDECLAFAQRFVDRGIQFKIEDILVIGPPWRTRIALRVHVYIPSSDSTAGVDTYNNRAVAFLEARWGRLRTWEDYEDTERVAAFDTAS